MIAVRPLLLIGALLLVACDPPGAGGEDVRGQDVRAGALSIDLDDASLHTVDGTRVADFGDQYPARSGFAIEARLGGIPEDAAGVHWFVYVPAQQKAMAYHLAERPPYRYPAEKLDLLPLGGPHRLVAQVWNAERETIASAEKPFRIVRIASLAKVAEPVGDLDPEAPSFPLLPYAQHRVSARPPKRPVGARFTLPDGREVSSGDGEAAKAWREDVKRRYGGDPWTDEPSPAPPARSE